MMTKKKSTTAATQPVQPKPTAMEALRVELVLAKAANVGLKNQLAEVQAKYDLLQFVVERDRLTPPALAGYVWRWDLDPTTNQPIGYVKTEGS